MALDIDITGKVMNIATQPVRVKVPDSEGRYKFFPGEVLSIYTPTASHGVHFPRELTSFQKKRIQDHNVRYTREITEHHSPSCEYLFRYKIEMLEGDLKGVSIGSVVGV